MQGKLKGNLKDLEIEAGLKPVEIKKVKKIKVALGKAEKKLGSKKGKK